MQPSEHHTGPQHSASNTQIKHKSLLRRGGPTLEQRLRLGERLVRPVPVALLDDGAVLRRVRREGEERVAVVVVHL